MKIKNLFKQLLSKSYKKHVLPIAVVSMLMVGMVTLAIFQFSSAQSGDTVVLDGTAAPCESLGGTFSTAPAGNHACHLNSDVNGKEIVITDPGYSLFCDGHILDGLGVKNTAVNIQNNNVKIQSCTIQNYIEAGVLGGAISGPYVSGAEVYGSNFNNITGELSFGGVVIHSNGGFARVNDSTFNNIENTGVMFVGVDGGLIQRNTMNNCAAGVHLGPVPGISESVNVNVSSNHIVGNTAGIAMFSGGGHLVYNNELINDFNVQLGTTPPTGVSWNLATTYASPNIIGGPSLGGNFWSDYTGVDANGDGFGDTPYVIDASNQDNYPLVYPSNFDGEIFLGMADYVPPTECVLGQECELAKFVSHEGLVGGSVLESFDVDFYVETPWEYLPSCSLEVADFQGVCQPVRVPLNLEQPAQQSYNIKAHLSQDVTFCPQETNMMAYFTVFCENIPGVAGQSMNTDFSAGSGLIATDESPFIFVYTPEEVSNTVTFVTGGVNDNSEVSCDLVNPDEVNNHLPEGVFETVLSADINVTPNSGDTQVEPDYISGKITGVNNTQDFVDEATACQILFTDSGNSYPVGLTVNFEDRSRASFEYTGPTEPLNAGIHNIQVQCSFVDESTGNSYTAELTSIDGNSLPSGNAHVFELATDPCVNSFIITDSASPFVIEGDVTVEDQGNGIYDFVSTQGGNVIFGGNTVSIPTAASLELDLSGSSENVNKYTLGSGLANVESSGGARFTLDEPQESIVHVDNATEDSVISGFSPLKTPVDVAFLDDSGSRFAGASLSDGESFGYILDTDNNISNLRISGLTYGKRNFELSNGSVANVGYKQRLGLTYDSSDSSFKLKALPSLVLSDSRVRVDALEKFRKGTIETINLNGPFGPTGDFFGDTFQPYENLPVPNSGDIASRLTSLEQYRKDMVDFMWYEQSDLCFNDNSGWGDPYPAPRFDTQCGDAIDDLADAYSHITVPNTANTEARIDSLEAFRKDFSKFFASYTVEMTGGANARAYAVREYFVQFMYIADENSITADARLTHLEQVRQQTLNYLLNEGQTPTPDHNCYNSFQFGQYVEGTDCFDDLQKWVGPYLGLPVPGTGDTVARLRSLEDFRKDFIYHLYGYNKITWCENLELCYKFFLPYILNTVSLATTEDSDDVLRLTSLEEFFRNYTIAFGSNAMYLAFGTTDPDTRKEIRDFFWPLMDQKVGPSDASFSVELKDGSGKLALKPYLSVGSEISLPSVGASDPVTLNVTAGSVNALAIDKAGRTTGIYSQLNAGKVLTSTVNTTTGENVTSVVSGNVKFSSLRGTVSSLLSVNSIVGTKTVPSSEGVPEDPIGPDSKGALKITNYSSASNVSVASTSNVVTNLDAVGESMTLSNIRRGAGNLSFRSPAPSVIETEFKSDSGVKFVQTKSLNGAALAYNLNTADPAKLDLTLNSRGFGALKVDNNNFITDLKAGSQVNIVHNSLTNDYLIGAPPTDATWLTDDLHLDFLEQSRKAYVDQWTANASEICNGNASCISAITGALATYASVPVPNEIDAFGRLESLENYRSDLSNAILANYTAMCLGRADEAECQAVLQAGMEQYATLSVPNSGTLAERVNSLEAFVNALDILSPKYLSVDTPNYSDMLPGPSFSSKTLDLRLTNGLYDITSAELKTGSALKLSYNETNRIFDLEASTLGLKYNLIDTSRILSLEEFRKDFAEMILLQRAGTFEYCHGSSTCKRLVQDALMPLYNIPVPNVGNVEARLASLEQSRQVTTLLLTAHLTSGICNGSDFCEQAIFDWLGPYVSLAVPGTGTIEQRTTSLEQYRYDSVWLFIILKGSCSACVEFPVEIALIDYKDIPVGAQSGDEAISTVEVKDLNSEIRLGTGEGLKLSVTEDRRLTLLSNPFNALKYTDTSRILSLEEFRKDFSYMVAAMANPFVSPMCVGNTSCSDYARGVFNPMQGIPVPNSGAVEARLASLEQSRQDTVFALLFLKSAICQGNVNCVGFVAGELAPYYNLAIPATGTIEQRTTSLEQYRYDLVQMFLGLARFSQMCEGRPGCGDFVRSSIADYYNLPIGGESSINVDSQNSTGQYTTRATLVPNASITVTHNPVADNTSVDVLSGYVSSKTYDANQLSTGVLSQMAPGVSYTSGIVASTGENKLSIGAGSVNFVGLNGALSTQLPAATVVTTKASPQDPIGPPPPPPSSEAQPVDPVGPGGGLRFTNLSSGSNVVAKIGVAPSSTTGTVTTKLSTGSGMTVRRSFVSRSGDILITPLDNGGAPIEVDCVSDPDTTKDQCYAGAAKQVENGVESFVPSNLQLIGLDGTPTLIESGLTSTDTFDSVDIDGVAYNQNEVNFVALAPAGTKVNGNGVEIIECSAQLLQNGQLNELVRYIINGQPMCEPLQTGTVNVRFQRHTVQTGTKPGSTKVPVIGATVKAFSFENGTCAYGIGSNPHNYETILNSCTADVSAVTGSNGEVSLELMVGDWIIIAKDPVTTVVAGTKVDDLLNGEIRDQFLQVIVKPNGSSVPAKTTKKNGSLLYIIEPEYVVWSNTTEYYPYVFESEGEWNVAVAVIPPEGFVSDVNVLNADVNNEYEALQFTLVDQGSCWECGVATEITVKHNGKTEKIKSHIPTAMTEDFIKAKGLSKKQLEGKGVMVREDKKVKSKK